MKYITRVQKCVATNSFVVGVGNDKGWNSVTYIDPITMQPFNPAHTIKKGDLYYRFTKDKGLEDLNGVAFATARKGNEPPMAQRSFADFTYSQTPDFSLVQAAVDKYVDKYEKEESIMDFGNGVLKGMFGRLGSGMCRLTMDGQIAVKAGDQYKYYDKNTGSFINTDNFVFPDLGMDMFFVIPTNAVVEGDIIIANGVPKYVLSVDPTGKNITVLNYIGGIIETIMPERHIFMGNIYFYGKVVSLFNGQLNGANGANNIMKFYMMSEMMKSMTGGRNGGDTNPFIMMALMGCGMNGMGNMFDNLFANAAPAAPATPAAPMTTNPTVAKEAE